MLRFLWPVSFCGVFSISCDSSSKENNNGDSTFQFNYYAYDCQTSTPLAGAEFCDLISTQPNASCGMSNSAGAAKVAWEEPPTSADVLTTWTLTGYTPVLMTSHYTAADYAEWEILALQGTPLSTNYCFFSNADNADWLTTGEIVADPSLGHVVYELTSNSGAALSDAVVSLVNDAGDVFGQVRYQHDSLNELEPTRQTTSSNGLFVIANVPPGDYTLVVTHDSLLCTAGYSFASNVDNQVTVPVQAGAMTNGSLNCRNGD